MADAPEALRAFGKRYRIPLTRGLKGEDLDALVRAHPIEGTWSALEYACHVRDVLQVQRERLQHALLEDDYAPAPMRRDERVVELGYNKQDPATVADELAAAADALAADIEAFASADFERTMIYNYPERVVRPLTWVVQHTVHEGEHHLLDVGRVQRAARGR
jgi:S-DNA-T family DNA segregation ATPase FtsK/SpoIIIE